MKCKDCTNSIKMEQRRKNKEERLKGASKKCNKCKDVKSICLFKKHPTSGDGYANSCLECTQPEAPVDTPEKICSLCHTAKLREEFNNCKTAVDGLFAYCRSCTQLKNKAYKAKTRPQRPTEQVTEQLCKKCKQTREITLFKPHKQSLTGYGHICIHCKQ